MGHKRRLIRCGMELSLDAWREGQRLETAGRAVLPLSGTAGIGMPQAQAQQLFHAQVRPPSTF